MILIEKINGHIFIVFLVACDNVDSLKVMWRLTCLSWLLIPAKMFQ